MRAALATYDHVTEKRMMGGTCFFLHGNMVGGADRDAARGGRLMFRVGKDREAEALKRAGAYPVVLGERRMGGLIFVDEASCDAASLAEWVKLSLAFVTTLPPKPV